MRTTSTTTYQFSNPSNLGSTITVTINFDNNNTCILKPDDFEAKIKALFNKPELEAKCTKEPSIEDAVKYAVETRADEEAQAILNAFPVIPVVDKPTEKVTDNWITKDLGLKLLPTTDLTPDEQYNQVFIKDKKYIKYSRIFLEQQQTSLTGTVTSRLARMILLACTLSDNSFCGKDLYNLTVRLGISESKEACGYFVGKFKELGFATEDTLHLASKYSYVNLNKNIMDGIERLSQSLLFKDLRERADLVYDTVPVSSLI